MKKFISFILCILISISLIGCGSTNYNASTENVVVENSVGDYMLYDTDKSTEYLAFMSNFDANKYEIIDISVGYYANNLTYDYYMITYKKKGE